MRRTGFARKVYTPAPPAPLRPVERRSTYAGAVTLRLVPKEEPMQHAGYMNLVRAMACMHCGHPPRSDFAHADQGKGQGIKTDCRRGFPLCRACHHLIGSTGKLGRDERRRLEAEYGARTRAAVQVSGQWPKRLPIWTQETP